MDNHLRINNKCTGCNLCAFICPKNAINIRVDKNGFWYPSIKEDFCSDCGLCLKMCPVYGNSLNRFKFPVTYVGWNNDDSIRKRSSSGGIFYNLAMNVLQKSGSVYGAAYSEDYSVKHIRIDKKNDLHKLLGSKYVQSKIDQEVFDMIENDIRENRIVLFSGTPCQTAAVNNKFMLGGVDNNLITVDVVCHGVPSPKAWKYCLNELRRHGEISSINMRAKVNGWNKFHMLVNYIDGTKYDKWFNDSTWGKSFVSNLFLRECCYNCKFKSKIRTADISLGDFWAAARGNHPEYNDGDKGTSVILVNSDRGYEFLHSTACYIEKIPYDWIPADTYAIIRSSSRNEYRNQAFSELDSKPFGQIVNKYCRQSLRRRILKKLWESLMLN